MAKKRCKPFDNFWALHTDITVDGPTLLSIGGPYIVIKKLLNDVPNSFLFVVKKVTLVFTTKVGVLALTRLPPCLHFKNGWWLITHFPFRQLEYLDLPKIPRLFSFLLLTFPSTISLSRFNLSIVLGLCGDRTH
jgi:hypothetical protein